MSDQERTNHARRALDNLFDLQVTGVDSGPLLNLAMTMVIDFTGATRATLLRDEGGGLEPTIAMGGEPPVHLEDPEAYARDVVESARESRAIESRPGRIAAPILLNRELAAVLVAEAGPAGFPPDAETLVRAAAGTMARLLHSARLVNDAARRTRNVETIEAVGSALGASNLADAQLGQALDATLRATASDDAALGLLSPRGELLDLHLRGDATRLRPLAEEVARCLTSRRLEEATAALGPRALLEPLRGEILISNPDQLERTPLGFLLARRDEGAGYGEADRTVFRAIAHLVAGAIARLEYYKKAAEDALTGTGSRLALELAIVEKLDLARKAHTPLSLLLVDVDRFKLINDQHGHLAGDAVLKGVAERLQARLRSGDFVARFGGDEFLVLLPGTPALEALPLAESLRERVAAQPLSEHSLRVTLSIGVAAFPEHGTRPGELLARADEALYRSKAAGRNKVSLATHAPA